MTDEKAADPTDKNATAPSGQDMPCPYCQGSGRTQVTLGSRLRFLRGEVKLSQKDMAELLETPPSTYSRIEADYMSASAIFIIKVANACNTSADWLLGRSDDR